MQHLFGRLQEDTGGQKHLEIRFLEKRYSHNFAVTVDVGADEHSHRIVLDKADVKELNTMLSNILASEEECTK